MITFEHEETHTQFFYNSDLSGDIIVRNPQGTEAKFSGDALKEFMKQYMTEKITERVVKFINDENENLS